MTNSSEEVKVYLKNAWYVAAWSDELGAGLITRTICELPVLLYRKENGDPVAMGNLCPHRFAPLHMGKKIGDTVQCGYHGMVFGESGKCVLNPHHGGVISPAMKVASYPVIEKNGAIFVWTGDEDAADPALLPDFSCYTAPAFETIRGAMDVAANYELITDNLLDLTHADFLHEGTLSSEAITISKLETIEQGSTVWANRWCPDGDAPPVWSQLMQNQMGVEPSTRIDHWLYMRWDAPGHLLLDVGITGVGQTRDDGIWVYTGHHLTPVSPTRTLYYWTVVRNHGVRDQSVSDFWQGSIDYAFAVQDKPMIEAQQAALDGANIEALHPVGIPADVAGAKARRALSRLIKREAEGARPELGASALDLLLKQSAGSRQPVLPVV
jgi:phenylpropionate dioxygenase-like ring-hydroxylating dioxygenase large terminal subunit